MQCARILTMNWFICGVFSLSGSLFADPSAKDILKKAENIRSPDASYKVDVTLKDFRRGKETVHTYEVLIKGRDKALVRFLTPLVDQGTKVLMVEEQMWIFMPSTAKPLRISPRQKLTGNAAYGDIIRLDFVDNYTPKFVKTESLNGTSAHVLDLIAIEDKPVTYDRVQYWVDTVTFRPIKAFYQTREGKTLREGTFEKFEDMLGVKRPLVFKLNDFLEKEHRTELIYKSPKKASLPDLLFEKQNFGRE